ncbi:MAG TPA: hypothetical protein VFH88_04070 [Candidatus Krumholzibacteria bacterium]|nr:hypothetical protein [Candidatus Krumholzibacteria bacterium]
MTSPVPRLLMIAVLFLSAAGVAAGQEIPRDQYLRHMPLSRPRLGQETEASRALHLFGDQSDPGYRDVDPVDGIDDTRYRVLQDLAVRFAPYLVQNTTNIPTNFDTYVANRDTFALWIDEWDMSGEEPTLRQTKAVNFSALNGDSCAGAGATTAFDEHPGPTTSAAIEDCKLSALLDEFSPAGSRTPSLEETLVRQRAPRTTILFFDFPGSGPSDWELGYEPEYEKTPADKRRFFPHAYAHPFLQETFDPQGNSLGYELILQYWFFYPSNDSGMNHEGDWEHMNVVVSPRSMVEQSMPADVIAGILSGEPRAQDDPLVIKRLDYYFHHLVMSLDLAAPNVYLPRAKWKEDVETRSSPRIEQRQIWEAIRNMAYVDDDETVINTHPIGYIGADNKGLNQAMSRPGGTNRDPHGTYPFPGRYRDVGPGGTTDQVSVHLDDHEYWKQLEAGKQSRGPTFKRGAVLGLDDPDRLRIVPDWERIIDRVNTDARVRREWSWLVLPIRWGYPATRSPFSGVLEYFDTGNVSPVGPSFSTGWNVSGPAAGFTAFEPHQMPSVFPMGLQDSFRNDFGFFNLTLPVLFNLPPLDFATRIVAYPLKLAFGRRDPVFFPSQKVPFRFVGLSSGVSAQIVDEDWDALSFNPQQYDEFLGRILLHLIANGIDSTTVATANTTHKTNSVGPFFQVAFYIGSHFTSENTVRNARSSFGARVDFNNIPSYTYDADLNYWEYSGSLRYSILTAPVQPFIKAGYGWSWYRLENVRANGKLFDTPDSDWITPGIWPNVFHFGLGVEWVPWRRPGKLPGGTDLAFRVEYARYLQTLGLDLSKVSLEKLSLFFPTLGDVPNGVRVARDEFILGATVSF